MASSIGIKIANGEFYPLVEENSLIKKRLILTTVHDNQPSVQIDLYRSPVQAMTEAQYIGTVVVENIKPKPKGEPSIEMIISSDKNGNIVADALDLDNGAGGEHYVLTVSLQSMDDISRDVNIQDFELESNEEPPSGLYQHAKQIREREKKKPKPVIFILIGIILLLGLLAAWLFFFNGLETIQTLGNRLITQIHTMRTQPDPVVPSVEPAVTIAEPVKQAEPAVTNVEPVRQAETAAEPVRQTEPVQQVVSPPPVIQSAPAARAVSVSTRNPPVASFNVPAVIPREGVNYVIRWGDTLWDIAQAFYRDPWQYPRIARFNNISNANYIISGRTVRVPPRN